MKYELTQRVILAKVIVVEANSSEDAKVRAKLKTYSECPDIGDIETYEVEEIKE